MNWLSFIPLLVGIYCILKVLCNLCRRLKLSLCIYPVLGFFTVNVAFHTHDNLAILMGGGIRQSCRAPMRHREVSKPKRLRKQTSRNDRVHVEILHYPNCCANIFRDVSRNFWKKFYRHLAGEVEFRNTRILWTISNATAIQFNIRNATQQLQKLHGQRYNPIVQYYSAITTNN